MTSLSTVYQVFLSKIKSDNYLATLEEDELEDELYDILYGALPLVLFPKTSLAIEETQTGVAPNIITEKNFVEDLPAALVDLIAEAMVTEWFSKQINDLEIIELKYSTKDFQLTSQANQLKSLREAHLDSYGKFNRKLDNYQRQSEDGKSVFSKLTSGNL